MRHVKKALTGSSALWKLCTECQTPEAGWPGSSPLLDLECTHYSRNTEPALQPEREKERERRARAFHYTCLLVVFYSTYDKHQTDDGGESSMLECGRECWPGNEGWRCRQRSVWKEAPAHG